MSTLRENMQLVDTVARLMEGLHADGLTANAPEQLPIEYRGGNVIVSTVAELPHEPKTGAGQPQKMELDLS